MIDFSPPYTPLNSAPNRLEERGYVLLQPEDLAQLCEISLHDLIQLAASWENLPADTHLRDGGKYRKRRHSSFCLQPQATHDGRLQSELILQAHRAHWQPVEYNALHGGLNRWFEPVEASTINHRAWQALLTSLPCLFSGQHQQWFIEAHQFRIDTEGGIGRPTPEGAHRDGVDWVAVILVNRQAIKGGETRVFDANGPVGERFTLTRAWSLLLLDDTRVIHETTPIQPIGSPAFRDTLVITYRSGGFLGPVTTDQA